MCLEILYKSVWITFIPIRAQVDIIIDIHRPSCTVLLFLSEFKEIWIFSTDSRKVNKTIMEIIPMGAPLKGMDWRQNEADRRFMHFCKSIKAMVKYKQLLVSATNFNVHQVTIMKTHRISFRKTWYEI